MKDLQKFEHSEDDFRDQLIQADEQELLELKVWLFKENIRLMNEKKTLQESKEQLQKEKEQVHREMKEVHQRISYEQKRLKQEEMFFEQKLDILKGGFADLEAQRKIFEKEKYEFSGRKMERDSFKKEVRELDATMMLFQGVKSQLALKKRYRDLLKMFHPDNIAGDHEMILLINSAYEELKEQYESSREA